MSSLSRRFFLVGLFGLLASPALAGAGPPRPVRVRRRVRRRRRRIRRRRIRRRVRWGLVRGRRLLVVPVGLAVGWELLVDDKVVLVKEVHEHKIVVEHSDGSTQEIDVAREDTEENSEDLEGSEYEVEVEEEVEGDAQEDQ